MTTCDICPDPYTEPILILGFNRPDRVRALVDALRPWAPQKLFFSIDGPREGVESDAELVLATQQSVASVDWVCDVRTRFLEHNLGCGRAVSSAIDWFFSEVERGVILEDDVLPGSEFLRFCAELLEYYEDDKRVFAISGCNFAPPEVVDQAGSYRFSALTHVWGWASWRRAWMHYEFDMRNWRSRLPLRRRWEAMGGNLPGFVYWTTVFDWMRWNRIDTWDYQWTLAQMSAGGLTATSNSNLVENVGFRADATHTVARPDFIRDIEGLNLPLSHPEVRRDLVADRWIRSQVLQASTQGAWRMVKDNALVRGARLRQMLRGSS